MLVMLLVLCALSRRDGTLWNVLSLAMDGARDPTIFPRSDDVLRVDDDDPARDVLRVDDRRDW